MTQIPLDIGSLTALLLGFFTAVGAGLITILGWFSNRMINRFDERFDKADEKLEHLERTVIRESTLVERLQKDYDDLNNRVSRLETRK